MRSRTSFFDALGASVQQAAPLWVLYSLASAVSLTCTDIQGMQILREIGGESHAEMSTLS